MKALVKKALTRVHLHEQAGRMYRYLQLASRIARRTDSRIAMRYLAEANEPKLHLGCGLNPLDGWLNSDVTLPPPFKNVMYLDATRPFPFSANTFAYVYSEHMIEHLPFSEGRAMLCECFRVLAPGGKVRITTPDLAFAIDLYRQDLSALQERYIEWVSATQQLPGREIGFSINQLIHGWGHQFIYDEHTLRRVLEIAGFSNVVMTGLNQSRATAFRNLANERRLPDGLLDLESMTLEATK